jgi:hypothetical protein
MTFETSQIFESLAPGEHAELPVVFKASLLGAQEIKMLLRYEVDGP